MAEGLPLNLPDFAAVHESGYGTNATNKPR
jgi:hypothetical protein